MVSLEGTMAPGVLELRRQYEAWDVPRNVKKSVQRSLKTELQRATVDGDAGLAYPRESKLCKRFSLGWRLCQAQRERKNGKLSVVDSCVSQHFASPC